MFLVSFIRLYNAHFCDFRGKGTALFIKTNRAKLPDNRTKLSFVVFSKNHEDIPQTIIWHGKAHADDALVDDDGRSQPATSRAIARFQSDGVVETVHYGLYRKLVNELPAITSLCPYGSR